MTAEGDGRAVIGETHPMAYTLDPGADVRDELRRVARSQVRRAIADLTDPGDDLVEAVHDCRKRCKMLRGLVRLARPALGRRYSIANATFRDAARQLSSLRDAHALLDTFDALCEARRENIPDRGFGDIRSELAARSEEASAVARPDAPGVAAALSLLRRGEREICRWDIDAEGFDALGGGLGLTYGRGRAALQHVVAAPTTEAFHEYRKRVKYTWYHLRLLDATAPRAIEPLEKLVHDLGDTLGDEHDLAVLADQLLAAPDAFGGAKQVGPALIVIEGQRADLRRRAVRAGARVHAEEPKHFVRRFGAYWDAWQAYGPELVVGDIATLANGR